VSENITRETDASVEEFIDKVEHPGRRDDSYVLLDLMRRVTGVEPKMWGPAIIGFGKYHYRYESGREGEMLRVGFSPRKANLALYLLAKGDGFAELLARLGKHKTGASCLYIGRLKDVDLSVLESLVSVSWNRAREKYGEPA
jgi:hypothetical protein